MEVACGRLSDANRSRTHTDSEAVGTRSDETSSLVSGNDVSCDEFEFGMRLGISI